MVDFFKKHLPTNSKTIATSDRHSCDTEYTLGFHYCDTAYLVPGIHEEENYMDAILKICKDEKIDLLFSFYDYDSFVLSKYLDRIKAVGTFPVISSHEINELCFDKLKTFTFLKSHGFNTPWTLAANEIKNVDAPSYPAMVKPRFGFGSDTLNIARNKEELIFFLQYYHDKEMIIQEFLEGPEYSFDILNDFDGNVITAVVKKKIKMRAGETDQGYTIKEVRLLEEAMKLGSALGHIGPLDVDLFLKEGCPYILELNPRFGGGYPITHFSGLDFTKLLTELFNKTLGSDYSKYRDYQEGVITLKDIKFLQDMCKPS
jgi:carbamoyl-phosphate synthase large subunit